MANYVTFVNDTEQRVEQVKVGFSWVCLFWTWFFAIPLFIKRVYPWALGIVALQGIFYLIEHQLLLHSFEHTFFRCLTGSKDSCTAGWYLLALPHQWSGLITFIISIYLGFRGNETIARYYLKNGYRFADPKNPMVKQAQVQWRMQI
jgi:hypothetical protein